MQNQFLPPESAVETTPYVVPIVTAQSTETVETKTVTQAVTAMLVQAEHKVRRRKRQYWAMFGLMEFMLLLPTALLQINKFFNGISHPLPTPFVIIPIIAGMLSLLLTFTIRVRIDAEELARVGGTRAIPVLMESLMGNMYNKFDQATLQALTLLLPQMQATDAPLLTSRHRQHLNRILNQSLRSTLWVGVDDTFTLAVLKAYEQVGDAKAIPFVERLANSRPRNDRERRIQYAAASCLPLLQANASGISVTQTLLRASMPETNTPDTLLRPATATGTTPDDELLRAAAPHDIPPSA